MIWTEGEKKSVIARSREFNETTRPSSILRERSSARLRAPYFPISTFSLSLFQKSPEAGYYDQCERVKGSDFCSRLEKSTLTNPVQVPFSLLLQYM